MFGGPAGGVSAGSSADVHGTLLGMTHLADVQPVEQNAIGVVYSATDLKLERRVTVRVLNPMNGEAARVRFDHECKLLGRLSAHPNVITLYDAGFATGDRPYLITESIDGRDLPTLLDDGRILPWESAADVALQICAGLEQAHRAGVLHRNICPSNILMAGTTPKVTGFGISAMADDADPAGLVHRAPETFDDVWDERTDLYSVASVLYQMIDGNAPFWRPSDAAPDAIRLRVTHEPAPTLDPDLVPAPLGVFVSAALSKDPLDRPQTADEFLHELGLIREGRTTGSNPSVLHGKTGPMAVHPPPPPPTPSPTPGVEGPHGQGSAWFDPELTGPPAMGPVVPGDGAEPGQDQPLAWAPPIGSATTVYADIAAAPPPGLGAVPPPAPRQPSSSPVHSLRPGVEPAPTLTGRKTVSEGTGKATAFMLAMALIAVGMVGLAAVVAISAFDSGDDSQAAPLLSDPDEPATVAAVGTNESTPVTTAGDAMSEETTETSLTTTEAEPTTLTTIPRTAVPKVVGDRVEAATRRLADAGFEVLIVGRKAINAQPGTVIQQKPDANDLVILPFTVTLYIPKAASLPAMVGRSADAVCLELAALSLNCNRVQRHDDRIPAGSVVSTNPVEGTEFVEGSTVEVVVSRGPVMTVAVPPVAGLTRADAETTLLTSGFVTVAFASQPSASVPTDQAIGTNPAAGTSLATDQQVTILVSTGPPVKVQLPDVIGSSAAQAEAALAGVGVESNVVMADVPPGDPGIGVVVAMDPGAGASVDVGSTVTITVGRQQADATTTTAATAATDPAAGTTG